MYVKDSSLDGWDVKEPTDIDLVNGYTLQANAISRGIYRMPPMARRLIFIGTAALQKNNEQSLTVELEVGQVIRALELDSGGKSYSRIKKAAQEASRQVINIEQNDGGWRVVNWMEEVSYTPQSGIIRLQFSEKARPFVLQLQRDFSRIDVADFARLPGRHSQRLYELFMANSGHEGKQGNKPGTWWVKLTKQELRTYLAIQENEYKSTKNFRCRVVDNPVAQINNANVGLHVDVEYQKQKKVLVGFVFHIQRIDDHTPKPVNPSTMTEQDQKDWIETYPELYARLHAEERANLDLPLNDIGNGFWELTARGNAVKRLKEEIREQNRLKSENTK